MYMPENNGNTLSKLEKWDIKSVKQETLAELSIRDGNKDSGYMRIWKVTELPTQFHTNQIQNHSQ